MSILLGILYIFIIGAVLVSMAVLLLLGKKETSNKMYLGCQGMVIVWCLSQVMILLSETEHQLAASYFIGNIGICFVGAFWLGFAFAYGKRQIPMLLRLLPFFLSAAHYLLVVTNQWHHLYYTSFSKANITHGIFFFTNVAQTYLFVVAGAFILYKASTAQALIISAVLVPIFFNVLYLTGFVQASFDITPLGFGVSGILVLLATFKYRFMEVNIEAFDVVLSGLSDGVAIFDKKGWCTFCNAAFENYMGKTHPVNSDYIQSQIKSLSHIGDNVYEDSKKRYLQLQVYQNMTEISLEQITAYQPVVFVIKDISRYYELLHQTRQLAVTNERLALERERNRIAQQVHDTAGHTLTMIQSYMKLASIANGKHQTQEVQDYLKGAGELTNKGIKELRESINQLRREAESQLVTQGILQLTDRIKEIPTELTIQGEDSELYSHLSSILYDCVRESITNTLKYSHAKKLDVVLRFKEDRVELVIADDGLGSEKLTYHHGLLGIKERVKQAGGTVRFSTGPNEGFLTRIEVPI